jgi:hypothetical protein
MRCWTARFTSASGVKGTPAGGIGACFFTKRSASTRIALRKSSGIFQAALADALDQGVLAGGEEADGVFKKQPFDDDKSF